MKRTAIIIVLAIALAAGLGTVGAYFTAQTDIPDNYIRAGSVLVSAEPTSAALSIDSLAPGGVTERSLTVANTGSLPSNITVTAAKKAGITDFYNALTCRVTHEGTLLYEGPMNALRTAQVALAASERARLTFAVGLPPEAGNDLSGDYVRLTVYVDAEQTH